MSIKSFPEYEHLLQEKYVEYKHIFLQLLKLVSKTFMSYRLFQINDLMHNSFIFQQYICYTTLLNIFEQRAARNMLRIVV